MPYFHRRREANRRLLRSIIGAFIGILLFNLGIQLGYHLFGTISRPTCPEGGGYELATTEDGKKVCVSGDKTLPAQDLKKVEPYKFNR